MNHDCVTHARECTSLLVLYGPCKYDLAVVILSLLPSAASVYPPVCTLRKILTFHTTVVAKENTQNCNIPGCGHQVDVCPQTPFCILALQVEAMPPANLPCVHQGH